MSNVRFNTWLHNTGSGGVYQDNIGRVGIGSSVPTATLTVTGNIGFTTANIRIGDSNTGCSITSGSNNAFLGNGAGRYTTTGGYNNFFGSLAGCCNTTGSYNNFLGNAAGRCNTAG